MNAFLLSPATMLPAPPRGRSRMAVPTPYMQSETTKQLNQPTNDGSVKNGPRVSCYPPNDLFGLLLVWVRQGRKSQMQIDPTLSIFLCLLLVKSKLYYTRHHITQEEETDHFLGFSLIYFSNWLRSLDNLLRLEVNCQLKNVTHFTLEMERN